MVVLSVAVLSKSGKVLVARQYVDMARIRIEGILAAFPKLVESGAEGVGKQHTYVETGSIRYVYQPIEGLYLLLVTTRGSNIVQDLDTLRLLSKVVPEYAQPTEEDITRNVFDLIFAFDEVITLGYKESITLDGIRKNLEMDSHNEKLHLMVLQSKMNEAKDEARRKAASIKASRASNPMPGMGSSSMPGMGSSGMTGFGSSSSSDTAGADAMGISAADGGASSFAKSDSGSRYGSSSADTSVPTSGGGMKLGKGLKLGSKTTKGLSALQQMAKEEGIDANALVQQQSSKANVAAPGAVVRSDPIEVKISESVMVVYDKDGALHKIEVKGSISLTCHEENAKVALKLQYYGDQSPFQFTPHPNMSKPDFGEDLLKMKNAGKPYPKDKTLGILKWRFASKDDEGLVPLKVTCWPEANGDGTVTVSMELELASEHLTLQNLVISVPLGTAEEPEITAIEGGTHRHNTRRHLLEWDLGTIDKDTSAATLEFVVPGNDDADFFPVSVSFTSDDTICPVHVPEVFNVDDGEPVKFGLLREMQSDRYEVVAEAE